VKHFRRRRYLMLLAVLLVLPLGTTAQPVGRQTQANVQPSVVTGILRTNTGVPMVGILMSVAPVKQPFAFSALPMGLTDNTGRYRLDGIAPGRYHILIGWNGPRFFYPGVADIDKATAIEVLSNAIIEIPDIVVSGGTVTGSLVGITTADRIQNLWLCCDYFRPITGSRAQGIFTARFGTPFTAKLSADGSFVFPFVPPGNYFLAAIGPGPGSSDSIKMTWALGVTAGGATGLQLDMAAGSGVEGTVRDQRGNPVPADVRLRPKSVNSAFNTIGPPMDTGGSVFVRNNDDGTFSFATGTGGLFIPQIAASRDGVPMSDPQDPSQRVDPSLQGIQQTLQEKARVRSATTGPDGRFAFERVPPGPYALEVNAGGVTLLGREIQVGIAEMEKVSLEVPAIQLTGRVVAPGGDSLPKLNYIRLVRSGSDSNIFYVFPDTEGHFSLMLLSGQYRIFTERLGPSVQSVLDGGRDITDTEITLEAGRNSQIVVTLAP